MAPKATMTGSEEQGYLDSNPVDPILLQALTTSLAPLRTGVGSQVEVLMELAGIKAAIRTWYDKQPDQVIREASAYSARLTELWTDLQRLEAHHRQYTRIRTQQVTPVIEEVERQFRYQVSRIAMLRQDIDLAKG